MAYFPDLSPYVYSAGRDQRGVVHVGWLDNIHPYNKGKVAPHLVEKMKTLAAKPVELYRGFHVCELCPSGTITVQVEKEDPRYESAARKLGTETRFCFRRECLSNGEIRVSTTSLFGGAETQTDQSLPPTKISAKSGLVFVKKITFAAPVMIVHYIEAHSYLPPTEFLNALEMHPIE